jgi:hypothetical protein
MNSEATASLEKLSNRIKQYQEDLNSLTTKDLLTRQTKELLKTKFQEDVKQILLAEENQ